MIKIVNFKILDTGYVSTTILTSQTQLSDVNRAGYTGSDVKSFTINNGGLSYGSEANLENKPVVNTLTDVSNSLVAKKNSTIAVSVILARTTGSAGYNVNELIELSRLHTTKGLKLLYVDNETNSLPTLIEALGAVNTNGTFADGSPSEDAGTVSTTTPYLVGRVRNFNVSDAPANNSYWRITFNFEVSG